MRQVMGLVLIAMLLVVGCARARLARRYLSRCPAAGPEAAADLGIRRIPMDLDEFYAAVRSRAARFELVQLGAVRDAGRDRPILAIRHRGSLARQRILVVAGIHGNETAGLLAIPAFLELLEEDRSEYESWDVEIIAPANPVGVVHGSRYNGDGCDLNRDFGDPRTYEVRLIRESIAAWSPDLIVSLHEGPQDGYLLVVTSRGSRRVAEAAVRAVRERGITLARKHFAGSSLGTPGLSAEGRGTDFMKWALGLHTLGRFAASLGIGTYTTETSWSSENFEERILAHVVTLQAILMTGVREHGIAAQARRGSPGH
jgi:hypothetical protein